MQKVSKIRLLIGVTILSGLFVYSQDVAYKDVLLDGKPAKLNVATGEITLVNSNKKKLKLPQNDEIINTESNQSNEEFYVVKEGETLFDISKRFKLSMADIKKANNLESTLIEKDQKLRIRNIVHQVQDTKAETRIEVDQLNNSNFHLVTKGETLYSIAKRYNIEIAELKNHNNLNSNLIKVGENLRIRNFETANSSNSVAYWMVSKGDTLYSIAKKNGITVDVIIQLNALPDNTIYIGQKLKLK